MKRTFSQILKTCSAHLQSQRSFLGGKYLRIIVSSILIHRSH
jgi:hypothetical protein